MSLYQNVPLDAPSGKCGAVTPSDSVNLSNFTRAIYVGGAGNIAVLTAAGDTVTFSGVPAGSVLPVMALRVNSTNTTATNIVAMY